GCEQAVAEEIEPGIGKAQNGCRSILGELGEREGRAGEYPVHAPVDVEPDLGRGVNALKIEVVAAQAAGGKEFVKERSFERSGSIGNGLPPEVGDLVDIDRR